MAAGVEYSLWRVSEVRLSHLGSEAHIHRGSEAVQPETHECRSVSTVSKDLSSKRQTHGAAEMLLGKTPGHIRLYLDVHLPMVLCTLQIRQATPGHRWQDYTVLY